MPTAFEYFGSMAERYDSLVRRAVPRYDEMLARTVEYMPPAARRVLELGCGTGNLSLAVAERYPEAELTLVDGAAEMLALARERLGPGRRVACVESGFEELQPEARAFDLLVSSISLHHVVDKPALFRRLHAALEPGGFLVFSDQMRGRADAHHDLNLERMHAFWRLPGHLSAEEGASLDAHSDAHDHYASVPDQLAWLAAAGFREADCVWRHLMWGILTARA
jgi:tRNA (cmo5U34)-methyltransferase